MRGLPAPEPSDTRGQVPHMPRVEELLEQLGSALFITTLDLTKGYYQVSVHSEDREKTAFMCPMRLPECHLG